MRGALLLGAPEIYHWHFSDLANNVANIPYTNFVLAFRIALLVVVLAILATLGRAFRLGGRETLPAENPRPDQKAHRYIANAAAAASFAQATTLCTLRRA